MQTTTDRRLPALLMVLAALVGGCAAPASPPASERSGSALPTAASSGWRQALDAGGSRLQVQVFRGGRAANLGHNHVLLAGDLAGVLVWPDEAAARERRWDQARLELSFRLDALQLDAPALRAGLGPAYASTIGPGLVGATRDNMLKSLQAEQHPVVQLRTGQVVGEPPLLAVEVAVSLHGQTRSQWVAVRLDGEPLRASGRAVIRQSDFGIAPFSVLGGLLAVQDELVVEFELALR